MTLESAIAKSPCGIAQRRNRKGGFTLAMKVKGELRRVASVQNPRIEGRPLGELHLRSTDWTPAKERVA